MQDANKRSTIQRCFIRPKMEQSSAIRCLLKRNANQLKLNCAKTLILTFAERASDSRPQRLISRLLGIWLLADSQLPTIPVSREESGSERKRGSFRVTRDPGTT